MSRLARKPITIPDGTTVVVQDALVAVKGPKGEVSVPRLSGIALAVAGSEVNVTRTGVDKQSQANIGTMWSLTKNAIEGVSKGFEKVMEIQGVGYRASMEGKTLVMALGYSHPIRFESPEGVTIAVEKNLIRISGANKEDVGQAAALIRKYRKPEPYKGKGIRYQGEIVRQKAGKKAATK